jgi:glyoxylase I family protein
MPGQLAEWRVTNGGWLQMHREPEHAGHSLFNLAVDDIAAAVTSLRDRNYEPGDIVEVNNGVSLSSVTDPDGNIITLIGNFREDY